MTSETLVGIREYARYRSERGARGDEGFDSCSPAAVRKAIATGRIAAAVVGEGRDRQLRRELADSLWASNTMPSQQRPRVAAGAPATPSGIPKSPPPVRERARREPMTMQEANLLLVKYRARRERIEYLREIGNLIDAATARSETFELGRRLRDRALELPGRLADELAAEVDPRRVRSILDRELREVFAAAAAAVAPALAAATPPPDAPKGTSDSSPSTDARNQEAPPGRRKARPRKKSQEAARATQPDA